MLNQNLTHSNNIKSVNDPKSLLFLPPEIRLLIYRFLLISKIGHIWIYKRCSLDHGNKEPSNSEGREAEFVNSIKNLKRKGVIVPGAERLIANFETRNLPCPALPLFLCNSTIYREAAGVIFGEITFQFHFRDGERDWDLLHRWSEMIGRRKLLTHLEIDYDSFDLRGYDKKQRLTPKAICNLRGVVHEWGGPFVMSLKDDSYWFEVISSTIEQVFRELSCSDGPLLVTMLLPSCRDMLVPRLLYSEVDLQEHEPLPLFNPLQEYGPLPRFNPFRPGTSPLEWEYDQAGVRYSPKEFCIVPDLIEGYRKKYGKDALAVQWKGSESADKWDETKDLLVGCGWEILHWYKARIIEPQVYFTLRLGRNLTHGDVRYDVSACLTVKVHSFERVPDHLACWRELNTMEQI